MGEGAAVGTGAPAGATRFADTETVFAFVVMPLTGMAPFSNWDPSAGEVRLSVGASMTRNGTVMKIRGVVSAVFPVSGSTAVMSNWLRPRRRSTSLLHLPAASAETRYGSSRPAAAIVIVAPGIEVPRSVYVVVSSGTSMTNCDGLVTASVGGLANRTSWTPM